MKQRYLIFLFFLVINLPAFAQWTLCNPGHGNVYTLEVCGDTLFEGTLEGIYVSTNHGATWSESAQGLANPIVRDLLTSGNKLFAATDSGVYVTTDRGLSWNPACEGLTGYQVSALCSNDYGLFAATFDGGVFFSENDGVSWNPVNNGLENPEIHAIAARGDELYAGTMGNGVYRSLDNGNSWYPINEGLASLYIKSLYTWNGRIWAGSMGGFRILEPGAMEWSDINGTLLFDVRSYAPFGDKLFIGTDGGGVFYTPDNGLNWIKCNEGFNDMTIYSMAICGPWVFAGQCCGNGLWRRPLEQCVGIESPGELRSVALYPVPFNDRFTLELPDFASSDGGKLYLYDATGRLIHSQNITGEKTVIPVANPSPGLYFLQIQTSSGNLLRKITSNSR